ncbi:uncharacterized protein LACBIDRAFT_328212 [Laccaria bicolor S238N-H82]|uniref:Predicted protein n=1 Tax=Laccaria bicolor (strain S238N-H82 / ATCC MYA-4686) TaxID=486041 RepID=B0DE36_LACBS|nr:uncharacterized protein LACBIDRAFT_328212 [Laccaria bicolor S238N-H82]EDR07197.1 predicted protein [Laccaria bicolor S238N-H82]|eukprot:XP_001882128.1 predicted protein [Laccaria bicolor S238N-H82]
MKASESAMPAENAPICHIKLLQVEREDLSGGSDKPPSRGVPTFPVDQHKTTPADTPCLVLPVANASDVQPEDTIFTRQTEPFLQACVEKILELVQIGDDITADQRKEVKSLIAEFADCFALSLSEVNLIPGTVHKLDIPENTSFRTKIPQRSFNPDQRAFMEAKVDEMLKGGIIRPIHPREVKCVAPSVLAQKAHENTGLSSDELKHKVNDECVKHGVSGNSFLQSSILLIFHRFWLEMAMFTLPGRDHTSSSTASSDGKGGTDSASKDGKSTKRTGPTYVYYRLYTKLGAFESNHTLYQNDRFIGRIPSKLFAPPHTVASIKRSLCKLEGLLDPDKALVFAPLSSPAPKEDSTRLSLNALSGPGLSELDPIALVVESEKRTKEASQSETQLPECSDNTDIHYGKSLYYRVYLSESEGEAKAKTSFDESDISLGRINTLSIAPPHTAGSLKARIAKVEGLVTPGHALYKDMELFQDTDSDAAMNDTDIISFQGDDYPGSDKRDHVALVNATTNTAADQKAKPTPKPTPGKALGKYPLDTAATNRAFSNGPDSNFTKRAQLTHGGGSYTGYMAINSKGEKGFVMSNYVQFI